MAAFISPHQLTSERRGMVSKLETWLSKARSSEHLSEEQSHNVKLLFQAVVNSNNPAGAIEASLREWETALQLTPRNVRHIARIEKEILRTSPRTPYVQTELLRKREAHEVREERPAKRQKVEPPAPPPGLDHEHLAAADRMLARGNRRPDERKPDALPETPAMLPEQKSEPSVSVDLSQVRAYPPHGCFDTICGRGEEGIHWKYDGKIPLFQTEEIIERCHLKKRKKIGSGCSPAYVNGKFTEVEHPVYVAYTKYEKRILQQQAGRGCTAAASAMLILDHGGKIDLQELQARNLGNDEDMMQDIQRAGLTPLMSTLDKENLLPSLRKAIQDHGSAIVSIGGEVGGHVIVVDDVSEKLDSVRLRDPYHGWEITVTAKAFLQRGPGLKVVQIQA